MLVASQRIFKILWDIAVLIKYDSDIIMDLQVVTMIWRGFHV